MTIDSEKTDTAYLENELPNHFQDNLYYLIGGPQYLSKNMIWDLIFGTFIGFMKKKNSKNRKLSKKVFTN